MYLRLTQDIAAVYPEGLNKATDAPRPAGSKQLFKDLLASSAVGGKKEYNKQAATTAEILNLEMMRSSLCLDGSPPPATELGGGMLNSLLAAYGAERQSTAMPLENAPPPVSSAVGKASSGADAPGIASIISKASQRYGVDEGLIRAVIQAESNFKSTAVSPVGAQGLMQLMPATATSLGVTDSFDPEQNVMAGTRFLKDLLNRYGGNIDKALAAYNWGPGNLERSRGGLPRETQNYLSKVKKLYADYEVG